MLTVSVPWPNLLSVRQHSNLELRTPWREKTTTTASP
jgi:hypothetical protein